MEIYDTNHELETENKGREYSDDAMEKRYQNNTMDIMDTKRSLRYDYVCSEKVEDTNPVEKKTYNDTIDIMDGERSLRYSYVYGEKKVEGTASFEKNPYSTTMNTKRPLGYNYGPIIKSKRTANKNKRPLRYNDGPVDKNDTIDIMDAERSLQYNYVNSEKKIEGTAPVEKNRTTGYMAINKNSNRSNKSFNDEVHTNLEQKNYGCGFGISVMTFLIGFILLIIWCKIGYEVSMPWAAFWILCILGFYKCIIALFLFKRSTNTKLFSPWYVALLIGGILECIGLAACTYTQLDLNPTNATILKILKTNMKLSRVISVWAFVAGVVVDVESVANIFSTA